MFLNSVHCIISSCCELAAQSEAKVMKKGFHLQGQGQCQYQGLNLLQDQSQEKRLHLQGQDQRNISQG